MGDGGDRLPGPATPGLQGLAERIETHITDLEVVGEEVRKVQELISETLKPEGKGRTERNLGEASDRLEKRVRRWLQQLGNEYRVMKTEILRYGNDQKERGPSNGLPSAEARRIFLLDSRALVRRGLRRIIEDKPGFLVTGEAGEVGEAELVLKDLQIDLVIVHVAAMDLREIGNVAALRRLLPLEKIIVLTGKGDREFFSRLVRSGANAYLLDDGNDQGLFPVMEKVLRGEGYFSPAISEALLDGRGIEHVNLEARPLTRREGEILRLVAAGRSSREIGEQLRISPHTVDRHRANIMLKLNVKKATDLVKYAISQGLMRTDGGGSFAG
jgi:DNA-binding NarL/FixJ family response regulator